MIRRSLQEIKPGKGLLQGGDDHSRLVEWQQWLAEADCGGKKLARNSIRALLAGIVRQCSASVACHEPGTEHRLASASAGIEAQSIMRPSDMPVRPDRNGDPRPSLEN